MSDILGKLLNRKKAEPILGIDITNESIIISQIDKTKSGLELSLLVEGSTPQNSIRDGEIVDTTSVAEAIQELLEANQIEAKKAMTTVSGQSIITRTIQFPSMSEEELKEVVLHEAERYIPFPIDEVSLDFQILGEIEDEGITKIDVLLVAAQNSLIDTYKETFVIAGLELISIDIASFAVARALEPTEIIKLGSKEPIGLVLMRGETTDINIFHRGIPRFSRSIPIGSTTFIENIASNLSLSLEESIDIFNKVVIPVAGQTMSEEPLVEMASNEIRTTLKELTTEIQRSLEYYQSQEEDGIQQLILSGRGAKIKNLDKHLSMNLGLDIEICNPVSNISFDEELFSTEYLIDNSSIFVTSIGLAKRAAELKY